MTTLLLATRNGHKVEEIRAILGTGKFTFLTLNEFPAAPAVVEDANTFAGNATKKAVTLARWLADIPSQKSKVQDSNFFVLADDSGLEVDALNARPGVHSARFAAWDTGAPENSPDPDNNAKLLRLLQNVPPEKRTARFRCVLALTPVLTASVASASPVCHADEHEMLTQLFEGRCEGRIISASRGSEGFGYDPLFTPDGFTQTYAELGEEVKNRISHRARALAQLSPALRSPL